MSKKVCKKCGEGKPLHEFYRQPNYQDGFDNKCKECAKSASRSNYQKNRKRYQEYERERAGRAGRKQKAMAYQRKRRALYPEKNEARNAVANAIRDGKLARKPCAVCGAKQTHAHHDDYSKPLDVRWLCFAHHMEAHGKKAI